MSEDIIKIAKESLENLLNLVQEKFENIDVDLIDNVLNIETSDDQVLIVSLHEPTSQIWYSSPLSGALHFKFEENDTILFGRESAGVPEKVHKLLDYKLKIPMESNKRSLNLASSVAIILAECLKQTKWI